jgi:hypothetical protein
VGSDGRVGIFIMLILKYSIIVSQAATKARTLVLEPTLRSLKFTQIISYLEIEILPRRKQTVSPLQRSTN